MSGPAAGHVVAIVQPYVPEYRVPLFDRLRDTLDAHGLDLRIVHGPPPATQGARGDAAVLPYATEVRVTELRRRWPALRVKHVSEAVQGADLVVLELASGSLENYPILARRRRTVAVWGHGFAATTTPSAIDTRLERWQMRRAAHVFVYTDEGREVAVGRACPQSASPCCTTRSTPPTSDRRCRSAPMQRSRPFRAMHRIDSEDCLAYIGGLDESKRVPLLLEIGRRLAATRPSFHLLVAGEGRDADLVRDAAEREPWLHHVAAWTRMARR